MCRQSGGDTDVVSRRRSPRDLNASEASPEATLEAVLDELCVTFGFCLAPSAKEALRTDPPSDAFAFTDRVITAEGLDPITIDTTLRTSMVELVEARAGRIF